MKLTREQAYQVMGILALLVVILVAAIVLVLNLVGNSTVLIAQ